MSQSATFSPSASAATDASSALQSVVPLTGRILLAPLFLLSGASKLAAPAATVAMIASAGLPFATLGFAVAVLTEVGGGLALLAGFRTRLVATAMALFTLAAALAFHTNFADQNQFIHFFKDVAITGGLLQLVAFGGGLLSLDSRRR